MMPDMPDVLLPANISRIPPTRDPTHGIMPGRSGYFLPYKPTPASSRRHKRNSKESTVIMPKVCQRTVKLSKSINLRIHDTGPAHSVTSRDTRGVKVYTGRRGSPIVIDKKAEGAWLKGELVSCGLTSKQAADMVGIPLSTLRSYLDGRVHVRPYTRRLILTTLSRNCKSRVSVQPNPEAVAKCRVVGRASPADHAQRASEVYSGMVQLISAAIPKSDEHNRNLGIVTRRFFGGSSQGALAREFGVSRQRISVIIRSALSTIRDTPSLAAKARGLGTEVAALSK